MKLRVLLFGATGMVGEGVLFEAIKDSAVEAIFVVSRSPGILNHRKVTVLLHNDFFDYTSIADRLAGYDACFFCIGVTSIGKTPPEYRMLTYDLTMATARTLARLNPDMVFCYVSGAGTDSSEQGPRMWARVKGKTENDLMKLPFKAVYAFRPGYIRPTPNLGNAPGVSRLIAPLYPALELLFPKFVCTLEDVGRSMVRVALDGYPKKILECVDITRLARTAPH